MNYKTKGFSLVEVICCIALVGIIAVSILPLINNSIKNIANLKNQNEMSFIAEMVIEKLKTSNAEAISTLDALDACGYIEYLDSDIDTERFKCSISKVSSTDKLIEFIVVVEHNSLGENFNVEYKASVLRK